MNGHELVEQIGGQQMIVWDGQLGSHCQGEKPRGNEEEERRNNVENTDFLVISCKQPPRQTWWKYFLAHRESSMLSYTTAGRREQA